MKDDEYWGRVIQVLRSFLKDGEEAYCDLVVKSENRTCEMCGKSPISWVFLIKNSRQGVLRIGSECVKNYPHALTLMDRDPRPMTFFGGRSCQQAAEWINEKCPGAVVFECDDELMVEDVVTDPNDPRHPLPNIDNDDELEFLHECRELGEDPDDVLYERMDEDREPPDGLCDKDIDWDSIDYE